MFAFFLASEALVNAQKEIGKFKNGTSGIFFMSHEDKGFMSVHMAESENKHESMTCVHM